MLHYALTIFLSAFLLFQVQPLISKYILPWFGGTPAVWTTCMMFFQVLLLGGYTYAHIVATKLRQRTQVVVHLVVLAAALATLPIAPSARWKPAGIEDPTWHILALLAVAVGMPYFALATTSPLLQAWFTRTHPGRRPYRLYALSNTGSLLALLTFPFLVEPYLSSPMQAVVWSCSFMAFAALCAICALRTWNLRQASTPIIEGDARVPAPPPELERRPGFLQCALWMLLPAAGSVMLLAVTNQMCQDVAVVPFLWVLPLSLYLLSFIICFDNERWYFRPVFWPWLVGSMVGMVVLLGMGVDAPIQWQIGGFSFGLFGCCMVCHGELVRLKPSPRHLTSFYLMVSAGGALGGVFVTLIAPLIFDAYLELHYGMWACAALAGAALWIDKRPLRHWPRSLWAGVGVPLLVAAPLLVLFLDPSASLDNVADPIVVRYMFTLWVAGSVLLLVLWGLSWAPRSWLEWLAIPHLISVPLYLLAYRRLFAPVPSLAKLLRAIPDEAAFGVMGVVSVVLSVVWIHRKHSEDPQRAWLWALASPVGALVLLFFAQRLYAQAEETLGGSEHISRNFYGVLRVTEYDSDDPKLHRLVLRHGRISHGCQLVSEEACTRPTTYYWEETGVGLAILHHPRRGQGLHVGTIGLGVGTVAAYGREGDRYRFYEINQEVRHLATTTFTYLENTEAVCQIVMGDARLSMERELRRGERQGFDILVLDAFSGDAIPVHLLTREAFQLYLQHLRPDGIIAVHISNRYLELEPVVWALADAFGLQSAQIEATGDDDLSTDSCTWVLLTHNTEFLESEVVAEAREKTESKKRRTILWTDAHSDLFRILK